MYHLWSAPAERSGDGAFVASIPPDETKAASRFACRRTPYGYRFPSLAEFVVDVSRGIRRRAALTAF